MEREGSRVRVSEVESRVRSSEAVKAVWWHCASSCCEQLQGSCCEQLQGSWHLVAGLELGRQVAWRPGTF